MVTWLENDLWKKIIAFVAKCVRSNPAMFVYLSYLRDVGSLSVPCDESSRLIIYPTVFLYSFLAWKDIHLTPAFKISSKKKQKQEMIQFKVGFFTMCSQEFNLYSN